jgi:ABC-type amino acid transport system permease subunit
MKFRYLQTIMSTDILQFSSNQEEFSPKALQIYLAVTIPFMALTFGAWRVLYVLSKRREENRGKEMVSRVSSGNFFIV